MTDCLIIGGGLMGMLTARELSRSGLKVTLLEQTQTGRESSWAGGGIISPLYPWRYADSVTALASWGQQQYPVLAEELRLESGIDPEYTKSGLLILDLEERQDAEDWSRTHRKNLQTPAVEAISELEPALISPNEWALYFPDVAQIRNPRLAKAARGAIQHSVTVREQTQVTSLMVERGRVAGAEANGKQFEAEQTLVCAGAWSGQLLSNLPHPPEIKPVLGQMILFRAEPGLINQIVLYKDRYVIPRRDGRVLMGSTLEHTEFRKQTTESALQELKHKAFELFPELEKYPVEHHWAGLRPGSPDSVPYIGRHPELQDLYVNAGHFRNGVVLGPASCRLAADLMLGREPILDPAPYSLDQPRQ